MHDEPTPRLIVINAQAENGSWNLPHTPHYARTKLPALRYIILPLLVRLRKFYDVGCLAVCKRLLVPLG